MWGPRPKIDQKKHRYWGKIAQKRQNQENQFWENENYTEEGKVYIREYLKKKKNGDKRRKSGRVKNAKCL